MENGWRLNQYLFLEKLGEGGMAEVWKCSHQQLGHVVAIKFLRREFAADLELQHRFLEEGKRQATLNHPNIVRAVDFLAEAGRHFLVMEYIEGGSIEELLEREPGPMPLPRVLALIAPVLDALDYAHRRGVVHRDVKTSNILLDDLSQPHLTDFGIALAVGSRRLTQAGTRMGTPEYMSPEQINQPSMVGPCSDLYSTGVVLYQMLTGQLPFDADEGDIDFIIKQRHVLDRPAPLRALNPDVLPAVEAVVLRALEKHPRARFASAAEMAEALRGAAAGRVPAEPPVPADTGRPESPQLLASPLSPPSSPRPDWSPPPAAAGIARPESPHEPGQPGARTRWHLIAGLLLVGLAIGGGAMLVIKSLQHGPDVVRIPDPGKRERPIVFPPSPAGPARPIASARPATVDYPSPKGGPEPTRSPDKPAGASGSGTAGGPSLPSTEPPRVPAKEPPPPLPNPGEPPKSGTLRPPKPLIADPVTPGAVPVTPGAVSGAVAVTPPPETIPVPPKKERVEIFRPSETGGGGTPAGVPRRPDPPPEKSAPRPMSGVIVWALQLHKNQTYVLEGDRVSAGVLQSSDALPGEAVSLDVIEGARLDRDIAFIDQPSFTNDFRRFAIRGKVDRNVVLKIQWKRFNLGH